MRAVGELLQLPTAQAVIWVTLTLMAMTIAWYCLSNLRNRVKGNEPPADHLSYFREIHRQGALSEHEFRSIKANLGDAYLGESTVRATSPEGRTSSE